MKLQGLSVAWFRREDWPRWCDMDPDFQPDYQHWLRRMEDVYARIKATGAPVVKVLIDPDEFLAWSNATGAGIGTQARAKFAALKGMALDRGDR
jgi:predicted alpha/beta hydrolase